MNPLNAARKTGRWLIVLLSGFLPLAAQAQIRTDSSLGRAAQTLSGPSYVIPETLGKLSGSNLFHSFQTFNIDSGESAHFTTATVGIRNVISRVSGGERSRINGPLSLAAASGAPDFYLINPAGVIFGAGAALDVPGAFQVSTANYLKFPDGNFYADPTRASTFSSAEPTAFGFLGSTRASIALKDAWLQNTAGGIALLAGDVDIDHAGVVAGSGDLRIVALGAAAAETSRIGALPEANGRLEIVNGSAVYTEAGTQSAGGNVSLAAGDTGIRAGSLVGTFTTGSQVGGAITAALASLEIDGRAASGSTGISAQAAIGDLGAGGNLSVSARSGIRIFGGGMISSDTYGAGQAGNVTVKAGSLRLDGAGHPNSARITSRNGTDASGNAGILAVDVDDSIDLSNASLITSDSFGAGQAGTINLRAGKDIRILSDSTVASNAYAAGNGGTINIAAQNLTVDGTGGKLLTQISSQALDRSLGNAGSIHISTPGSLSLINGGRVVTDTDSSGRAGDIQVATGALLLDGSESSGVTGVFSSSYGGSGNAGGLNINVAGDAHIFNGAQVSSTTWSQGSGGNIVFKANNLLIDGKDNSAGSRAGIFSEVAESGQGGAIIADVSGHLQIVNRGLISTATDGQGNAGPLTVTAGQLTIDGKISGQAGIESSSFREYSTGNAGQVSVAVAGDALLARGGYISSDTLISGRAGDIKVFVGGDLKLEGGRITSGTWGSGQAGSIDLNANRITLTSGSSGYYSWILSDSRASGAAGSVNVKASRSIELAEGGFITSDAYGSGHAGTVSVSAPDILIGGSGLREGAAISSDTYWTGNAGRVEVSAQTLTIEGGKSNYPTGITSHSLQESSGHAGTVVVNASEALRVLGGGVITSSTEGAGRGGEVQVKAASIELNGAGSQVGAMASKTSSGQPGSVTVFADGALLLREGASLSIENEGNNAQASTVSPSLLTVQAARLTLENAAIKANSTGNVAAGEIEIRFSDRLSLNWGRITTSANAGNGGAIAIEGGKLIDLNSSQITTSVLGLSGNGGDIKIGARALAMNTGFIQANSAAPNASGGHVGIDVQTLLPSGNTLYLGGQTPYIFAPGVFAFSVIQAAAPTGVTGFINVTAPVLDLSGALSGLSSPIIDAGDLGRNPCQTTGGSSLSQAGRGGFPASALDLLGPERTPTASAEAAPAGFRLND